MTLRLLLVSLSLMILSAHSQCVVRVGSVEPLTGPFATLASQEVSGFRLWEQAVNDAGGLELESLRCRLEVIVYDSQNDPALTRSLYRQLVEDDGCTFLLGCYSSSHGQIASDVAEELNVPIVLAGSAADSIYQVSNDWTVGVLSPATEYYVSLLNHIRLYGVSRVAWISESPTFTTDVCGAITALAPALGMDIVYSAVLPSANLTSELLDSYLTDLIATSPDVYLSCAYLDVTTTLTMLAREHRFSPSVTGITVAIGNPTFEQQLGDGVNFILGPVQWDPSIRTTGADVFNGSAADFAAAYELAYNATPSYQAAGGAAAGVFLQTAIELVGSLDQNLVMSVLKGLRFSSFFGEIGVDVTGANRAKTMVALQYNRTSQLEAVAPSSVATSLAVIPAPTWDERVDDDGWYDTAGEIVITTIASILIVLTFATTLFVAVNHKNPVISAASPPFLILILLSSCFLYSTTIVWQLYATDASCAILPWLFGIGWTLFFGCMVLRTWRISQLFTKQLFKTKSIRDVKLFAFLSLLMLIEFIILAIWTGVSRLVAVTVVPDPNRPSENYNECQEQDVSIWAFFGPLLGYNVLLALISLYLSFRVRNVDMVVFNESKEILFAVYNLLLFGTLVITLQAGTGTSREATFLIRSLCVICGVLLSVLVIMVPKLVHMKNGYNYHTKKTSSGAVHPATVGSGTKLSGGSPTLSTGSGTRTDV